MYIFSLLLTMLTFAIYLTKRGSNNQKRLIKTCTTKKEKRFLSRFLTVNIKKQVDFFNYIFKMSCLELLVKIMETDRLNGLDIAAMESWTEIMMFVNKDDNCRLPKNQQKQPLFLNIFQGSPSILQFYSKSSLIYFHSIFFG